LRDGIRQTPATTPGMLMIMEDVGAHPIQGKVPMGQSRAQYLGRHDKLAISY
jgi:hypothetical protein